jgi:hypothetical protein
VPIAVITIVSRSIEAQGCTKLIVIHAGEIVSRINISCPAKEELLECPQGTRTQRINYATQGDLYEILLCARNRYQLEVLREYPRPIGHEVVLRERYIPGAGHCRRPGQPRHERADADVLCD